MATKKPSPNQVKAITRARFELADLRAVLAAAQNCIAQMDAQDSTRNWPRTVELKAALGTYSKQINQYGNADLRELDSFIN